MTTEPVESGPTLQAIGFTIAGGSIVLFLTFIFFAIAVIYRSPNIAPRCTAREENVIYNPDAQPNTKSRLAWCFRICFKAFCFMRRGDRKKFDDDADDDHHGDSDVEDVEDVEKQRRRRHRRNRSSSDKVLESLSHDQYRGGPMFGWIPWTLSLSYGTLLKGVPGTGTRQSGAMGTLLRVNLDGIVLLRYHAIGLRVAILATVLCVGIILPLNITARCYANKDSEYCSEYSLSNFEQTTLKNIPPLDLSGINVTETQSFEYGFFGTSINLWGSAYSAYLGRLYGVVFVSWTLVFYTLRALKNEWQDALALRRVYYLEGEHWENRKMELEETYIAATNTASEEDDPAAGLGVGDALKRRRQINKQRKKQNKHNNLIKRDPWIPHPEQRETVPNVELYSVLVGQIPSKPREVMEEEDLIGLKADGDQELDWQLAVTTTFFDHCVPNQPGFSSSVAAVTILPDAPKLALAWRRWYKHVGLLRRLRFIRTLISEMRDYDIDRVNDDDNPSDRLPPPIRKQPSVDSDEINLLHRNNEEIQLRIDYYKNVLGSGRHDEDVESLLVHALNYGPEQTAVYAREFAQGAAACCPNGCGEERLKSFGIDQLVDLEEEIKEKVETSFKELLEAQSKNIMSKNDNSIQGNLSSHEVDLPPLQTKRTASVEKTDGDNLELKLMEMGRAKTPGNLTLPPPPVLSPNPVSSVLKWCQPQKKPETNPDSPLGNTEAHVTDTLTSFYEKYALSPTSGRNSPARRTSMSQETILRGNAPGLGNALNSIHPTDQRLTVSNEFHATSRENNLGMNQGDQGIPMNTLENISPPVITKTNQFSFPFAPAQLPMAPQQDTLSPLNDPRKAMSAQGKVRGGSSKGSSFDEADMKIMSTPPDDQHKSYIPDLLDAPHTQTNNAPFATPSGSVTTSTRNRLGTGYSFRTMNSNEDRRGTSQWKQYEQIRHDDNAAKGKSNTNAHEPFSGVWEYPTSKDMMNSFSSIYDEIKLWCNRKTRDVVDDLASESTFAVVTFTSRQAAVAARYCLSDGRGASRWIPEDDIPVPPLADAAVCDIKTCRGCCRPVTLTVNPKQQLIRKIISFCVLAILYVFYTIPLSFATSFVSPDELIKIWPTIKPFFEENDFLRRFLTGFAPALFYSIFFAICPVIFKTISNFGSNAVSVNQAEYSALQYYWYFMLFTAFSGNSLATMGLKFFDRNNDDLENEDNNSLTNLLVAIAGTLPAQVSATWLNWIIFRTFITLPLQYMLQVNTYIFQWLGWKCCRRCVMGGGPGGPIPYRIYVDSGVVFLCTIALAPVCPLIAPTALLYFLYCSPLWRRNLIFMYRPKFDTGGLRWPFLSDVVIQSIIVAQILLSTVMSLKKALGPAILAAVPIIPTIIQRRALHKRFLKSYKDAALLQTSLLDGWDNSQATSFEKREGFRQFLVDAHKAAYVPICIAGGAVSTALTAEPAVVVPYEGDNPNPLMNSLIPDDHESTRTPDIQIPEIQPRQSTENGTSVATPPQLYQRASRQFGASMRRMPRYTDDGFENRSRCNTLPCQIP